MKLDLYKLLPAVYRNQDLHRGEPLRALLDVLAHELEHLWRDIDRLYDDWFIETCDEWVVPYIGDLLAVGGLHPGKPGVFSLRGFVANTLAYRRRKGTASVLANISQDVSGWSASVTEFFQLLTTTQHHAHPRPYTVWSIDDRDDQRVGMVGTLDIRKTPLLASLGTPFDLASRSIDIRPFTRHHGWYNVDRLGVFVWRLTSYPMHDVPPRPVDDTDSDKRKHFHPLRMDIPLFINPVRQSGATERRREWEVPTAMNRAAFAADIERYYGEDKSVSVSVAGVPVPVRHVAPANLGDWKTPPDPTDGSEPPWIYIDVELGRLVASAPFIVSDTVRVIYHYGFSANIGGGPYGRLDTATGPDRALIRVARGTSVDSLQAAIDHALAHATRAVIRIMDSDIYIEDIVINLCADQELVIEATDGARPTIDVPAHFKVTAKSQERPGTLRLRGLLIEGELELEGNVVLDVEHCTLLPTGVGDNVAAMRADELHGGLLMEITIRHSIVGALWLPPNIKALQICDSIVGARNDRTTRLAAIAADSAGAHPGPAVMLTRTTVFGPVHVSEMPRASEVIFTGRVEVVRKQGGCLRYCYVDVDTMYADIKSTSRTPRRLRCQPDLALAEVVDADERRRIRESMRPIFVSERYGEPCYGRLATACDHGISRGAEDGSEMGAFSHLMESQREANLREAVRRYLPFGLDMNIIYADEEIEA